MIGECLHNIKKLDGKVVSVTTDGFITNIEDLENKLLSLPPEDTILLYKYRSLRLELSDDPNSLEITVKVKGSYP